MTEKNTVALAREGNIDARELLYRKYYGDVYRYCVYRCGDIHTGEDLTQEVFLRFFRYTAEPRAFDNAKAYIIKIACHVCTDYMASHTPVSPLADDFTDRATERLTEGQMAVRRAIAALGDDQRQVIILYYYNNIRINRIAEILETPCSTVKSRLRRGRERLKQILIQEGFR
ncbi:MAG: sigma-70 family RNA polymerase sigma factor [Eubacteriales bacterium]|nr:sigma-70 family RNA polymerase sigma factor [Eubacteriales bacterium]